MSLKMENGKEKMEGEVIKEEEEEEKENYVENENKENEEIVNSNEIDSNNEEETIYHHNKKNRKMVKGENISILIKINRMISMLMSTKWLPWKLKNSPWTRPILLFLLLLFIFTPIKQIVIMIGIAFVLGYIYGIPNDEDNVSLLGKSNEISHLLTLLYEKHLFIPSNGSTSKTVGPDSPISSKDQDGNFLLSKSAIIDGKLSEILERLSESLIHPWFAPLCKSGDREFYHSVKATMKRACINFLRHASHQNKESISLLVYGITASLTTLMKDYKEFEQLIKDRKPSLKSSDFLPFSQSFRSYFHTNEDAIGHLRQLSAVILKSLLPKQESRSINLIALLKELLASGLLWSIIDRALDPDFINLLIVKVFSLEASFTIPLGYSLLAVRIVKGKNMPIMKEENHGGFYLILHVSGCPKLNTRRVRRKSHQSANFPSSSHSHSPSSTNLHSQFDHSKRNEIKNGKGNEIESNQSFPFSQSDDSNHHDQLVWNQKFYFDIPNESLNNLRIHIQLMSYRYTSERDLSLGYAKIESIENGQFWLKFPTATIQGQGRGNEDVNPPQVFIDMTLMTGKRANSITPISSPNIPIKDNGSISHSNLSKNHHQEERMKETLLTSNNSKRDKIMINEESATIDSRDIDLETALQNNELFMEFYEYLQTAKAPSYLQFMMNVDAYRQFTAIELHIDPSQPIQIEDYFRLIPPSKPTLESESGNGTEMSIKKEKSTINNENTASSNENHQSSNIKNGLSKEQKEQLKTLRRDALDIYLSHFAPEAKYRIPIDSEILRELEQNIQIGDKIDPDTERYVGGPIGPNIFGPAYLRILKVLNDVYYPRFKESSGYQRIMDHASRFSTLQFTLEDDRTSTYSLDNQTNVTNTAISNTATSIISANTNESMGGTGMSCGMSSHYATSLHSNITSVIMEEEGNDDNETCILSKQQSGEHDQDQDSEHFHSHPLNDSTSPMMVIGGAEDEEELTSISNTLLIKKEELQVLKSKKGENKKYSEKQVSLLEKEIKSIEVVLKSKADELSGRGEDFWMDLSANVTIKVEAVPETSLDYGFLSYFTTVNPHSFNLSILKRIKKDGKEEDLILSTVTRSFAEFEEIYAKLKKAFPKVTKLTFPAINSKSLTHKLGTFMQLICSDRIMRSSPLIREFVTLDSAESDNSTVTRRIIDTFLGQKAGNLILGSSKPSISSAKKLYEFEKERFTVTTPISGSFGNKSDPFKELKSTRSYSNLVDSSKRSSSTTLLATPSITNIASTINSNATNIPNPLSHPSSNNNLASFPPLTSGISSGASHSHIYSDRNSQSHIFSNPSSSIPLLQTDESPLYRIGELEDDQIEMILEITFKFIMEAFDLNQPNQWFRRRLLGIFKRLLRQAYGDSISKSLSITINSFLTESKLYSILSDNLESFLWPNGIFIKDIPLPIRSPDQQYATMLEARSCWLKAMVPSIESITGHYNAISGLNRIFGMLQEKEFTKTLAISIMDITVLTLFSSDKTK